MLEFLFHQPRLCIIILLALGLGSILMLPNERTELVRSFALNLSLLTLSLGLLSTLSFNKARSGFQFLYRLDVLTEYNLGLTFGVDGLSLIFILLTLFVFPLCFLSA